MSRQLREIPAELLDSDKDWTPAQRERVKTDYGPLAETLDELVEFIRTADDFIACEDSSGPYPAEYAWPYSSDAFVWAASTLLSAKALRTQVEKVLGTREARSFYDGLRNAFGFFATQDQGYTIMLPEWPIPRNRHNPAAEALAQTLEQRYKEYLDGAQYVFRRNGDTWLVTYDGTPANINDSRGMFYIHSLLSRPNEDINVLELAGLGPAEIASLRLKGQTTIDHKALRSYSTRLGEIESELDEAKEDGDLAMQLRMEEEKRQILGSVHVDTLNGKSRTFSDTHENARNAVGNAIRRAYQSIEKHNPSLYQHLAKSIQPGHSCRYSPDRHIPWEL